jgi:hypothetical protein
MDPLKALVSECLEREIFIKVSESLIVREAHRIQAHIQQCDSSAILTSNNNIVRLASRIVEVAQLEMDNSEDEQYKSGIHAANQCLKDGIKFYLIL